jgi:DNA repair ATPase RecN
MDEQRLQRIEDKIDRLAELAVNAAVMQNEMLNMQKQIDDGVQRVKDTDKDVEDLRKEVKSLKDRQSLIIKIGSVSLLAILSIMTGVNLM